MDTYSLFLGGLIAQLGGVFFGREIKFQKSAYDWVENFSHITNSLDKLLIIDKYYFVFMNMKITFIIYI